jgi:YVTN family beta-propeller protein
VVTAQAVGMAAITAAVGDVSAIVPVVVPAVGPPDAIVIDPPLIQVKQGATIPVTARVVDAIGTEVPGLAVTLNVAHPAIAQLIPDSILGLAPGPSRLTATYGTLTGGADIEVFGHPSRANVTTVPMSGAPFGTAVSRDGRMFVGRHTVDTVSSAVLPGNSFSTHLFVGRDPVSLALDSAGRRIYVTKQFSGNVGIADAAATALMDSIPVTGSPLIAVMSPDQSALFVTTSSNTVQRIVLATRQVTTFDSYPAFSNGMAFHPSDTLMYVALVNGNVYEYHLPSGGDRRTFSFGGGLFQSVAVSDDGAELYVADENGAVRFWSLSTGGALPELALAGGPFDLKVTPDGSEIWVSLSSGGAVVVIDRATRMPIDTIQTGGIPRRIAFDRFGAVGLIGNESGWADVIR